MANEQSNGSQIEARLQAHLQGARVLGCHDEAQLIDHVTKALDLISSSETLHINKILSAAAETTCAKAAQSGASLHL